MNERTGGCLCGQVRFRLAAEPVMARLCWCRDCQRIAGNGTANAIFPSAALSVWLSLSDSLKTGIRARMH